MAAPIRRVYVHVRPAEGDSGETATFRVPLPASEPDGGPTLVSTLVSAFVEKWNAKAGAAARGEAVRLVTDAGKALRGRDPVTRRLVEGADVWATIKLAKGAGKKKTDTAAVPTPKAVSAVPAPATAAAPAKVNRKPAKRAATGAGAKAASSGARSEGAGSDKSGSAAVAAVVESGKVAAVLQSAAEACAKGYMRRAVQHWDAVLEADGSNAEALQCRGIADMEIGKSSSALAFFAKLTKVAPTHCSGFACLAKALAKLDRFEESIKAFDDAATIQKSGRKDMKLSKELPQEYRPTYRSSDIMSEVARVLFQGGDINSSVSVLTNVIEADENHTDALLQYATECERRGHDADAMRLALKALVTDQSNKPIKALLAKTVSKEGGLDTLRDELPLNEASSSAYAFLATVVKDFGAVEVSIELYTDALSIATNSHSYALNLMHTLECVGRMQDALDVAKRHLEANPATTLPCADGFVACKDVLDVVSPIIDVYSEATAAGIALPVARGSEDSVSLGEVPEFDTLICKWHSGDKPYASVSADGTPTDPAIGTRTLGEDELDLLAIYFTITKILWVTGNLPPLPHIVRLVEPVRRGRDLHLTTIRNENAYYCCIAQLLEHLQHGLPTRPAIGPALRLAAAFDTGRKPMYVCGDSHSLSPSWQQLDLPAPLGRVTLVNALVTGLKLWHIRDDSVFYPKRNFDAVTAAIPDGSDVLMLFGEIDCREGLLMAVEKRRYDSVTDAMRTVIQIYEKRLRTLAKRGMKLFVHPVVPVLNETRPIVTQFNRLLCDAMQKCECVTYVDFFTGMLGAGGDSLNPKYELDGTHMHPAYVTLLESTLASCMTA